MTTLRLDRRSCLRVLALSAGGSWAGWQWITTTDNDMASLLALADKVINSITPDMTRACLQRTRTQLNECQSESAMETMAPILHADDLAHQRIIELEGMSFSHTQIGLLTLLSQGRAS